MAPLIVCIGNPLLDITVGPAEGPAYLQKYALNPNDAILPEDKHMPIGPGFGGGQPPPPPPPPYTKHAQTPTQPIFTQPPQTQAAQAQAGQGTWWNPGFWTGLAAGGLGAWLVNNRTNNNNNYRARQREDGYRGFLPRRGLFAGREDDWGRGMRFRRVVDDGDDDNEPWGRGARTGGGGGGGGEMRRATGFGGTSSR
ncbi:hypothetical protein I304_06594 [Cryptococcus deuterogattii CBS 10090]|nr:hypothetical protein I304_06594 [Cryptococcus deuterogattii CBS 10090]